MGVMCNQSHVLESSDTAGHRVRSLGARLSIVDAIMIGGGMGPRWLVAWELRPKSNMTRLSSLNRQRISYKSGVKIERAVHWFILK